MEDKYLNVEEVCKFLKISRSTLFKLKKEAKLPYAKLGGTLIFDRDDLIKWVDDQKVTELPQSEMQK